MNDHSKILWRRIQQSANFCDKRTNYKTIIMKMKRTLIQWRFQVSFQAFFNHFCTVTINLRKVWIFFIDSFCLVFHADSNHIFGDILGLKLFNLPLFKVIGSPWFTRIFESVNFLLIHFVQFFMLILTICVLGDILGLKLSDLPLFKVIGGPCFKRVFESVNYLLIHFVHFFTLIPTIYLVIL